MVECYIVCYAVLRYATLWCAMVRYGTLRYVMAYGVHKQFCTNFAG